MGPLALRWLQKAASPITVLDLIPAFVLQSENPHGR